MYVNKVKQALFKCLKDFRCLAALTVVHLLVVGKTLSCRSKGSLIKNKDEKKYEDKFFTVVNRRVEVIGLLLKFIFNSKLTVFCTHNSISLRFVTCFNVQRQKKSILQAKQNLMNLKLGGTTCNSSSSTNKYWRINKLKNKYSVTNTRD